MMRKQSKKVERGTRDTSIVDHITALNADQLRELVKAYAELLLRSALPFAEAIRERVVNTDSDPAHFEQCIPPRHWNAPLRTTVPRSNAKKRQRKIHRNIRLGKRLKNLRSVLVDGVVGLEDVLAGSNEARDDDVIIEEVNLSHIFHVMMRDMMLDMQRPSNRRVFDQKDALTAPTNGANETLNGILGALISKYLLRMTGFNDETIKTAISSDSFIVLDTELKCGIGRWAHEWNHVRQVFAVKFEAGIEVDPFALE
ncbi:hypothetical protein HDU86_006263 [Geranomyces michiganensis]|nr:hypothetical protein HDU86_006263 [Geranomyces michiganensis]